MIYLTVFGQGLQRGHVLELRILSAAADTARESPLSGITEQSRGKEDAMNRVRTWRELGEHRVALAPGNQPCRIRRHK